MLKLLIYVWINIIPHLQIANIIVIGVRNEQFASTISRWNFKNNEILIFMIDFLPWGDNKPCFILLLFKVYLAL